MAKRDFLDLSALTEEGIMSLIDRAGYFKKNNLSADETALLTGKSIGLFFEKPSTRTRVAFETAIVRFGGHPIFLSPNDSQTGRGETIADTARVLSAYLDAIVIRTFEQEKLQEWAKFASIPIINGLSNLCHPCQILADFLTIFEHRGMLAGLNLTYVGDGNNIAHSLMEGGAMVGMNVTIASPREYEPHPNIVKQAVAIGEKTGSHIIVSNDPKKAAANADILYTDTWVSMGYEGAGNIQKTQFLPFQINQNLVNLAKSDCIIMHCLPAHRGEEITDEVMDGKQSVIFEQAANRLPTHQAILEWALQKN
jgi:ornithine carbamoyltransferase